MKNFRRLLLSTLLAFTGWAGLLVNIATQAAQPSSFEGYEAVSDAELDKMRGGFEFSANGQNFLLALSIESVSFINGELVAYTRLNLLQLLQGGTLASATTSSGTDSAALSQNPRLAANLAQADALFSSQNPGTLAGKTPATPTQESQIGAGLTHNQPSTTSTPPPASPLAALTSALTNGPLSNAIQNGPGNHLDTQALNQYLSNVIQNTVNDQIIRNITILNATLSMRASAAAAELNAALSRIPGTLP